MRAQVVSFHCVLRSQVGNQLLSSTFNNDVITQIDDGGEGLMLKGLADGLQNLKKGEKRRIFLSAKEAYGFYNPELVRECSRTEISNGRRLEIGNEVVMGLEGKRKTFRVVQANSQSVTLDANHPLAGMDLVFDIHATEARDATSEEIAQSGPVAVEQKSQLH